MISRGVGLTKVDDSRQKFPSPDRKTSWREEKERKLAKLKELRETRERRKKELLEREVNSSQMFSKLGF